MVYAPREVKQAVHFAATPMVLTEARKKGKSPYWGFAIENVPESLTFPTVGKKDKQFILLNLKCLFEGPMKQNTSCCSMLQF